MYTISDTIQAEKLIKLLNSVKFEYTWIFCKGIDKSQQDDIKFRKYLKRSFKKTFYYEDRKSKKSPITRQREMSELTGAFNIIIVLSGFFSLSIISCSGSPFSPAANSYYKQITPVWTYAPVVFPLPGYLPV